MVYDKKRVVIISDLHCGHVLGLTPPKWKSNKNLNTVWDYYCSVLKELRPIDILIVNGDAIDGSGIKSGAVELITSDRIEQTEIAIQCLKEARAKEVMMTYGTGYHTGNAEDYEKIIAKGINASCIKSHLYTSVNSVIFDCKHHLDSSAVPYGRHTAIAREKVWNIMYNDYNNTPKSDIVIRSHVHYHTFCGGPKWLGITTPALQMGDSKYGRKCTGIVDLGLVHFDVYEDKSYIWKAHILKLANRNKLEVR